MKNKVSVIITTYNDADYLKRSIDSVINQTFKNIELIVVDDGSSDDRAKIVVSKFKELADFPIIFFKKENGGPASARNFGIEKATGEYIIFLDADDELLPNSIEWRINTIANLDDSYGVAYGTAIVIKNNRVKEEKYLEYEGFLQSNSKLIGRKKGIPGGVPYYIFRTSILKNIKFRTKLFYNEDFEILLRISDKWRFKGKNTPIFKRFVRKSSWSKQQIYKSYEGVLQFLEIAKDNKLLEIQEIKQRRKENNLSMIKKLIKKRKFKETTPYIKKAFKEIPPSGLKENVLYFLNKILFK